LACRAPPVARPKNKWVDRAVTVELDALLPNRDHQRVEAEGRDQVAEQLYESADKTRAVSVGAAASLSRPMSSLAASPHTARRLALRLTCHTGLSLLFEVGVRPPHDGMRRMGRSNLSGALAADSRQDQRPLRTHPTRRPREDIFLPKQNALISLTAVFPALSAAAFRQPQEPRCRPCSTGTRYHRPTSGAELQPDAWRPRRSLDASRVAGPLARPMPSTTTILRRE
jgi:hypothetical protein